jgi:tetratricopeptide repeat protein 30
MADVMAENAHLTFQLLSKDFYDFMDGTVTVIFLRNTLDVT